MTTTPNRKYLRKYRIDYFPFIFNREAMRAVYQEAKSWTLESDIRFHLSLSSVDKRTSQHLKSKDPLQNQQTDNKTNLWFKTFPSFELLMFALSFQLEGKNTFIKIKRRKRMLLGKFKKFFSFANFPFFLTYFDRVKIVCLLLSLHCCSQYFSSSFWWNTWLIKIDESSPKDKVHRITKAIKFSN